MGRPLLFFLVGVVPACAWFTDFDSLSEPGPGAGADASDGPATLTPEDAGGGDGSTEAAPDNDAAAPDPSVVFEDHFDVAKPSPFGWDLASGGPTIEAVADAPSQPNALLVFSPKSAPVIPYLEKKVSTEGASAVSFSLRMKEIDFGGSRYSVVMGVTFPNQRSCTLSRHVTENKMYCQMTGVAKEAYANVAPGGWVELKMRWSTTGRIDVFGGAAQDFVQYTAEEIGSLGSPTLRIGLPAGNDEIDWKAYIDDVKITRE